MILWQLFDKSECEEDFWRNVLCCCLEASLIYNLDHISVIRIKGAVQNAITWACYKKYCYCVICFKHFSEKYFSTYTLPFSFLNQRNLEDHLQAHQITIQKIVFYAPLPLSCNDSRNAMFAYPQNGSFENLVIVSWSCGKISKNANLYVSSKLFSQTRSGIITSRAKGASDREISQ